MSGGGDIVRVQPCDNQLLVILYDLSIHNNVLVSVCVWGAISHSKSVINLAV